MFWYEEEVQRLEQLKATLNADPYVVFYGSSTIRMWDSLVTDFSDLSLINFGFGGSTLAACAWFFDRIMEGVAANSMVIYAGDNDLGDGRHPEEVFNHYRLLKYLIRQKYGSIPIGFISIKASIQRWGIYNRIHYSNKIIKEEIDRSDDNCYFIDITQQMISNDYPDQIYFMEDGLHLSPKGYEIVKEAVDQYSSKLFK